MIKNLTLEISSKPFRSDSDAAMESVIRTMFRQWRPLTNHAEGISVLLWTADGSEILEYKGNLNDSFEWAKWIGVANPQLEPLPPEHPEHESIHRKPRLYMENPPVYTYGWLRRLILTIKRIGGEETGKSIRVGATFDPGPEFAKSTFKYKKHKEICIGSTMGKGAFVCCYSVLNADKRRYAGYPDGIPDGTLFGEFLGRQTRRFCEDIGFDYLWLSNGFGFGLETWGMYGVVFDGQRFSSECCDEVRQKILDFWESFRHECPDLPLETRGTNLSTGIDLSSDAVPLRDIYRGGYNLEPPPNSPWAAINGDFGMEMTGWMSHIAEIPDKTYPFRFYTHDPWFLNSPWLDRYCRQPHDIFLPLSVARITEDGGIHTPSSIEFLTVDDSYGRMPETVPNEVIPHVIECIKTGPDQPGPLVWVYPFDEYHDMTYEGTQIDKVFFGDWFMRTAFNEGFPLNTVVSTRSFISAIRKNLEAFARSILVSPVPEAGNQISDVLLEHVKNGGYVFFYGPVSIAGRDVLEAIGVERCKELEGDFNLQLNLEDDILCSGSTPKSIRHEALTSGGGLEAIEKTSSKGVKILATAGRGEEKRVIAVSRFLPDWHGGGIVWVRGTNSFILPENKRAHHPIMRDERDYFRVERLMRLSLAEFGLFLRFAGHTPDSGGSMTPGKGSPRITISRHRNAFWFAGYSPDTTVIESFRFPFGAPLFLDSEAVVEHGSARYSLPRAWRKECRIFIEQAQDGILSCRERCSLFPGVTRRYQVAGLNDATVHFFFETGTENKIKLQLNVHPYNVFSGNFLNYKREETFWGSCVRVENVSGELMISW